MDPWYLTPTIWRSLCFFCQHPWTQTIQPQYPSLFRGILNFALHDFAPFVVRHHIWLGVKYMHVISYMQVYNFARVLPACQTRLSGSVLLITTVVQMQSAMEQIWNSANAEFSIAPAWSQTCMAWYASFEQPAWYSSQQKGDQMHIKLGYITYISIYCTMVWQKPTGCGILLAAFLTWIASSEK